ncbi:MAG: EAL domain-containing protein [Acidimicrobiales bacterium]
MRKILGRATERTPPNVDGDTTDHAAVASDIDRQHRDLVVTMEAAGIATWSLDATADVVTVSPNFADIVPVTGTPPVCSTDLVAVFGDEIEPILTARGEHGIEHFEFHTSVGDHPTTRTVQLRGRRESAADGSTVAVRGVVADVTGLDHELRRSRDAETLYRTMVESSTSAVIQLDESASIRDWNGAATACLGWTAEDVEGRNLVELLMAPEDRDGLRRVLNRMLAGDGAAEPSPPSIVEAVALHHDGHPVDLEISWSVVETTDGPRICLFSRDVSERHRFEDELTRHALYDDLTGLPNRVLLTDRINSALDRLERVANRTVGVWFVDIDRFKIVNDSLGHTFGDRVLVEVAKVLAGSVRKSDTVARFGGDGFVVVAETGTSRVDATRLADQILAAFDAPLEVAGRSLKIDLSIGVALTTDPGNDADRLLANADSAMHRAKVVGGRRFVVFDEEMHTIALRRLDAERALREALAVGAIVPYFQPVVTVDNRIVGAEALARWLDDAGTPIPPSRFIELAESTGMIAELGRQILDAACAEVARWRSDPRRASLTVAVNVSGSQLSQPGFVYEIAECLDRHDLPSDALVLELTETTLMDDRYTASRAVEELAALGISIAVDDFGTGYSSLAYLRRFPVDVLKLDRYFVSGLSRDPADAAIVGSMIDLASNLGLRTIAEGVEDLGQLRALRRMGCDYGQGFLWSEALPAEQFRALTTRGLDISPRPPTDRSESRPSTPATADPPAAVHPSTGDANQNPPRVLLIDDSTPYRSLLRAHLEHEGLVVVGEAPAGEPGIELAIELEPDLVVLDLAMPGLDGTEVLEALRLHSPSAKVVVLTGYLSAAIAQDVVSAGAVLALDKAVPPEDLAGQLRQLTWAAQPHQPVAELSPRQNPAT